MFKKKINIQNLIMTLVLLLIMYQIVINPTQSIDSASEGLNLWFNLLVPSLFPFIFITDLLVSLGFINSITKYLEPIMSTVFNVPGICAFPFTMSIMSGYPVGARLTSKLRHEKYISKVEGDRLISFASTSGPLFIIGTVLIGMLKEPNLAPLMLFPHYLGTITIGLIFRFYKKGDSNSSPKSRINSRNNSLNNRDNKKKTLGQQITTSIKDSIESILTVGGFVIIYSVIIDILLSSQLFNSVIILISKLTTVDSNILKGIVAGIIEMTNGCKIISKLDLELIYKIILLNFVIGWGGLSVHSQAISFISSTDISSKIYLFSKLIHGVFSAIYTYVIYILFYKGKIVQSPLETMPVFNNIILNNPLEILINSTFIILLTTTMLFLLSAIVRECRKRA